MKNKILIGLAILSMVACKQEKKDYVTFLGKITNKNSDKVTISNRQLGYKKEIKVAEDGTFKDTLKVKSDFYILNDGAEYAQIYLENGDEITMTLDAKQFDETIKFEGKGSEESAFMAVTMVEREKFVENDVMNLPKAEFDKKLKEFLDSIKSRLAKQKEELNPKFVTMQEQMLKGMEVQANQVYGQKSYIREVLGKGKDSPVFENYENYRGGKTSLKDFKGKYVYIDVWATWCGPCKAEIPHMKKVEEQYHGKNIEFVSISIDAEKNKATWKKMIEDKKMAGVQLFANGDRTFVEGYKVAGIPRFILIDPQGKIIRADAPRPSSPKLIELFNSLGL